MAQVQTFHVEAGATFQRELKYTNEDGTDFDLTGYEARLQLRETIESPPALDLALALDIENSLVVISMTAQQTSTLTAARYKYAIELDAPDGTVIRMLQGSFKVDPEVVR